MCFIYHNHKIIGKIKDGSAENSFLYFRIRPQKMAFLLPGAREVILEETKEKALELSSNQIKRYANQIAEDNELGARINDIGGVLTAFTQEGTKRTLGLLHKGEKVDRGCNYYLPVRFIPYIKRIASAAHLRVGI